MSAASDKLRRKYRAFSDSGDFSDTLLEECITDAKDELDQDSWGDLYERGAIALAAHIIELGQRAASAGAGGASAGGIGSLKTGDEQINYLATGAAVAGEGDVSLRTTPYGLEFLRLQRQVVRPFFVVI